MVEKLSTGIANRRRVDRLRLLARWWQRNRALVHQHIHDADAGDSVGQTVMDARDHGGAIAFQSAHNRQVPQRLAAIQMRADDLRGQRFQFTLRTSAQGYLADVIANVELGIELPGRQTNVEWRKYNVLPVTRDQRNFDSTNSRTF